MFSTLKKAKLFATGLFLFMTVIFLISLILESKDTLFLYLKAFSEAAMIGALADWFAVTALFRHPLGIPIPHTAIIPHNKDRIGVSLASFVRENFLTESVIKAKLIKINISEKIAEKISDEKFVRSILEKVAVYIPSFIQKLEDSDVKKFFQDNIFDRLKKIDLSSFAGDILGFVFSNGKDRLIFSEFVDVAFNLLHNNKDSLKELIKKESPWWVPGVVDSMLYKKLITKIEDFLYEMKSNENSENREKILFKIQQFISDLKSSPEFKLKGEEIKQKIFNDDTIMSILDKLISDIKVKILNDLASEESFIKSKACSFIVSIGKSFKKDIALQNKFNDWVISFSVNILTANAESISSIISETFSSWDPDDVSNKVEEQIGKDLQFIRINGTLIGGIVGLTIFLISRIFQ
ncbi:DUF445 domain-containing protein [soil metagenome]